MTNKETKYALIDALANRNVFFQKKTDIVYRTRCPFCGDTQKNLNEGHFYLIIDPDSDYRVGFNCFKCGEKGPLLAEHLSLLDIDDSALKAGLEVLNKTASNVDKKNLTMENKVIHFDYVLPEIRYGRKVKYVEDRLGIKFNEEDFKKMKLVTSLKEFLLANNIHNIMGSVENAQKLEDHFVGFLSFGNSHILFRDITDTEPKSWIKYPITPESQKNKLFYSMATDIDPMSTEPMTINLAEGVMDIMGANYHLGHNGPNEMNLCVSGKYYTTILLYLIDLGIVGSNVTVNIFSDNDKDFNKNKVLDTRLEYYKKTLSRYKHLYNQINVFYNLKSKDIGVTKDKICLKKYRL